LTFLRSPAVLMVIGGVATLVLFLAVVIVLGRTGGAKAISDNAAVIGALVALGGVFTAQMVSIALDARRSQEARDLEAQRAHEAALQNYLKNVGALLLEPPLHRASPGDNLSTLVRVQTLSVLEELDPHRKRILLRFLVEARLIYKHKPVVSLAEANLSRADLSNAGLSETDLRGVNLSGADLEWADLRGANLRGANLFQADLRTVEGVTNEQWSAAWSLEGATMPDGQTLGIRAYKRPGGPTFEDWLKNNQAREDDGENGGPS
jgi:hypothetical protein